MYYPTLEDFREAAKSGNTIPVYRSILADMETPVSAFYKLMPDNYAFLLESVEGGENLARYSFLGSQPSVLFQSKGHQVTIEYLEKGETVVQEYEDPLRALEELMQDYRPVHNAELPKFHGGAVGYMSYDMVRFVEELPDNTEDDLQLPDCFFMIAETLLIFDHVNHQIKVVANAHIDGDVDAAYAEALAKIEALVEKLTATSEAYVGSTRSESQDGYDEILSDPQSNFTKSGYEAAVSACERIHRRRRHHPSGNFAAVELSSICRFIRGVSGIADRQPIALHVLSETGEF